MSEVPTRGFVPHRQRHRHHHHHHHHHRKHYQDIVSSPDDDESEVKRPKVNPIFLWASQHEQKIVEVRCEDYDKRNRIKLTKTAQGWRSIPRTASNTYAGTLTETKDPSEKENGHEGDEQLRRLANGDLDEFGIKERINGGAWIVTGKDDRRRLEEIRKMEELRKHEETRKVEELRRLELRLREERKTEELRRLEEKLERQQIEELQRLEHLRQLEEIMISGNGKPDFGSGELKNRGAIRKRSEIRRNDALRRKENEMEERRKMLERRKKMEQRKRLEKKDESPMKDKFAKTNKVKHKKRKKDHVVLGYATLDGVSAWKLGKRRSNHRKQKRKRTIPEDMVTESANFETEKKKKKIIDFDHLMQPRVVLEQLQITEMDETHKNRKEGQRNSKTLEEESKDEMELVIDEGNEKESDVRVESIEQGIEEEEEIVEKEEEIVGEAITEMEQFEDETIRTETGVVDSEIEQRISVNLEPDDETDLEKVIEDEPNSHESNKRDYDKDHNENSIDPESADHSSDDDFQDILKMLDSTSFSSSKLVLSLKSAKLLEELELSLTGIEDDVEKSVDLELNEQPPQKDTAPYFVVENNNVVSKTMFDRSVNNDGKNVTKDDTQSFLNNNHHLEKCPNDEIEENEVEIIEANKDKDLEILETDSSRILKALRNTPGLSVSVANPNDPKSKNTSESRSPDSQMEQRELKTTHRGINDPSRFSGLSIAIPSWQTRTKPDLVPIKPPRSRIESPESTVTFPRIERPDQVNDEDDYDSQVMEDIRKGKDSMKRFRDGLESPSVRRMRNSNPLLQMVSNEAQAKRAGEDSGFRIHDLMMDDSKSRSSSAVSPQPSGIPCSPVLRRSSSAYLERLLPSPPCSVTCSEDAKNDLTLKGILSTPTCLEARELDKPKDQDVLNVVRDRPRQEPNPEVWKAAPREVPEVQQTYQTSGRPLLTSAQSAFLQAQQRAHLLRCQQIRASAYQQLEGFFDTTSIIPEISHSPATQLRQLLKTMGHLIPDPLLVPRHCLPGLAAAPAIEIPKLLTSRPELRLPEALNRPELLRDPDILVISIAHLQYVLDQGQDPFAKTRHPQGYANPVESVNVIRKKTTNSRPRPKLSCKPIGTLMPAPIDLSRSRKHGSYPSLLRVRSGLMKQEPEVSSTANNLEEHQLWHPLFSRQKRPQQQQQNYQATWHTTTFAS